jgi:hypothetical protein
VNNFDHAGRGFFDASAIAIDHRLVAKFSIVNPIKPVATINQAPALEIKPDQAPNQAFSRLIKDF